MTPSTTNLPAARLLQPHGLKGAVKAKVNLAHPEFLLKHKLPTSREGLTLTVTKIQPGARGQMILHLAESNSREDAEGLGGVTLMLPQNLIPAAPDGEVYFMDLVGRPVHAPDETPRGVLVGTVTAVLDSPAQPLLQLSSGALIPIHEEFIEDLTATPLRLTEIGTQLLDVNSSD